ncbi:MAG: methionyl-tRNA formyltransferase [Saprospiraceae bacterium]|nr:methionyl-tRNA formyltransferase [Pyrinomonadaceae bacterium]
MRIVFMGTPKAAVPSLERILSDGHEIAAVYSQPDRPSGRGNRIAFSPVKEFALKHDLPVFQPVKVKTQDALAEFQSHKADTAVVVAYGRILPQTFLEAYPNGAINVHFSLLPKYRGAAPVNWAIVNGETRTGVTTIQMDAGLDTGDILLKRDTDIGPGETSIELMDRLSFIGADLISETLAMYNELSGQPQNHEEATLAPMMKREDGLIDWEMSGGEVANRIRGFQPFPGSFSAYKEQKISIWKAAEVSSLEFEISHIRKCGEIIEAKGDNLFVQCGTETVLRIEEVQPEGKRRMSARDFVNGVKPIPGESFGSPL